MSTLHQILATIICFGSGYLVCCLPQSDRVRFRTGCVWFVVAVIACAIGFLTKEIK